LFKGSARTQTQVAVSPAKGSWFLINASPDLRQQLLADPDFAPASETRDTPIAAVVLTSADVDSVVGLLHLREFQSFRIYSTASVRRILTGENSLFRTLDRARPPVQWETLPPDQPVPLSQHEPVLFCTAVPLGGSFPDYVSDGLRRSLPENEAVIGLELVQSEKRFLYAPSLPEGGKAFRHRATQSNLALLDGTFWTDDELIRILGSGKTARQMGHVPLSGPDGLLESTGVSQNVRRILIHLNNTNPVLDEGSAENRAVRQAGWEIAHDGMEFEL
jgi:pyrroloquinoline quinone biosynthesis protein B